MVDAKIQVFAIAVAAIIGFALPSIINGDLREDLHALKERLAQIWPAQTPQKVLQPKEPGWEAVFAIAGLFAVAYLVLRQRK